MGCSRDQVAHALGIPVPTLQDWENDAAPIGCPAALEVVLRKLESQHDVESVVWPVAN
jgi:DNA-binding transcriptional regulator YiaG